MRIASPKNSKAVKLQENIKHHFFFFLIQSSFQTKIIKKNQRTELNDIVSRMQQLAHCGRFPDQTILRPSLVLTSQVAEEYLLYYICRVEWGGGGGGRSLQCCNPPAPRKV